MQLLADTRYGTRLMVELALRTHEGAVRMRDIADQLSLSQKYLEKIAHKLRKAGLIAGSRGPKGGYKLGRPAEQITVGELVRVLEDHSSLTLCTSKDGMCPKATDCLMRNVWKEGERAMFERFDAISLASLISGVTPLCSFARDNFSGEASHPLCSEHPEHGHQMPVHTNVVERLERFERTERHDRTEQLAPADLVPAL